MTSKLSIIQGTNKKPVSSRELISFFTNSGIDDGELFVGYPIISSPEGRYPIDAVWLSPKRGLIIFDLVEGGDPSNYMDRQDDAANKLEARLKTHRELMNRRNLIVPVHTITFVPGRANITPFQEEDYNIVNSDSIANALDEFEWKNPKDKDYSQTLSALQSISTIRKSKAKRNITSSDSRGAKLKRLEDSIATLDNLQGKAVIETAEGVQRIRGLAGSGKNYCFSFKGGLPARSTSRLENSCYVPH